MPNFFYASTLRVLRLKYITYNILSNPKNAITSHPVESGVSGTPGITGVIVVPPPLFVVDPPKSTPPLTDDAAVLITPFAICIGAVE